MIHNLLLFIEIQNVISLILFLYALTLRMSEKFCLRWNDFRSTVSHSFGILREEKDFFDVTLVSDDEIHDTADASSLMP